MGGARLAPFAFWTRTIASMAPLSKQPGARPTAPMSTSGLSASIAATSEVDS